MFVTIIKSNYHFLNINCSICLDIELTNYELIRVFYSLTDIIGRRGSRRLSVGALAGMSVLNLDSSKGSISMGGSNAKMGGLRIRNKAIPIINPLVKNPNWPSTIAPHKKGT